MKIMRSAYTYPPVNEGKYRSVIGFLMDARWTEYKIKEEISISDSMKNLGYINSL